MLAAMETARDPTAPDENVTVTASAGTGKTWLLVTRVVRLLLAGAAPDSILAITFTRKAAGEMQTRLGERLFELARGDAGARRSALAQMGAPTDEATVDRAGRLYEALLRAPRPVRATTFHAFCQEVLRDFPLEAEVPPGFELAEQTGELERSAWAALTDEATARPDGPTGRALERLIAFCGSVHALEQALRAFLDHRSDWWAFTAGQSDPSGFAGDRLAAEFGADEDTDPRAAFLDGPRCTALAEFRDLLVRHPTQAHQAQAEALATALDPEREVAERFAAVQGALFTQAGEPRKRKASKAQAQKMTEAGEQRFLALHETLCTDLEAARDALLAREALAANRAWYRAGAALLAHYQRIKDERRLLDFADLEWMAYRLLNRADNAQWVQFKLDRRIDHLLVDEFQDTNPTQWRLLLPLLEEMAAAEAERPRTVFLVGDAKQSIYRFRRAAPELLAEADGWLQDHLDAGRHPLHASRRSAPAVIEAVNRVFEQGPLAAVLDDFSHHETHHEGLWGRVEVLPLAQAAEEESEDAPREGLRDPLETPRPDPEGRHLREGRQLAARLQELVEAGTPVADGDGGARPLEYGDCLVLVRKRTHVHDYETALREAGIPYLGTDRGTLLESLEVGDLVALLEVLTTPYNNLSLARVLRSPLFDASDADLMTLAGAARERTWMEALDALSPPAGTPLGRARHWLGRWRTLADRIPIHDLLDRIYSEGDVVERYEAAYPAHLRSRARSNLTRLIELALEVDSGRYPSLTHFLARLEALREDAREAPDEAPAAVTGREVRLSTIHGAKGLEAPLVVLADAAARGGNDRAFRALVDWPPRAEVPERMLLVGRRDQQDATTRGWLEADQGKAERESANLLYVALTRARQYLLVSATAPGRGEETGWYGVLRTALDPEAETAADNPVVLERGTAPAAAVDGPQAAAAPPAVPEGLGRPMTLAPDYREIAPSHAAAGGATGGALDEDGRLRGIAIHRLLEGLGPAVDGDALLRRVCGELGLSSDDAEVQEWLAEARATFEAPALRHLFDPDRYQRAHCEVPVAYRQDGRTVHGIVDRLVEAESVWVVDFKTHRAAAEGGVDALAAHYRPQMALYLEGVRRLWPERTVRGLLVFTAGNHAVEVDA